jgi:hypothetical protein
MMVVNEVAHTQASLDHRFFAVWGNAGLYTTMVYSIRSCSDAVHSKLGLRGRGLRNHIYHIVTGLRGWV